MDRCGFFLNPADTDPGRTVEDLIAGLAELSGKKLARETVAGVEIMPDNIEIIRGGGDLLDRIEPLWERLRDRHRARAGRFAAWFARQTFAWHRDELLRKSVGGALLVEIARDLDAGKDVGYCVSSLDADGQGEIESIFIEEVYRHQGLGRLLHLALCDCSGGRASRPSTSTSAWPIRRERPSGGGWGLYRMRRRCDANWGENKLRGRFRRPL